MILPRPSAQKNHPAFPPLENAFGHFLSPVAVQV
jgi:hypothetical protein